MSAISRGDIFLLRNPSITVGAVISGTRPCVIIQNDSGNIRSPVTIVALITSCKGKKLYPTNVIIKASETGLDMDSVVLCNQIQTVAQSLLIKKIGRIPDKKMRMVDLALILSLDLDYR